MRIIKTADSNPARTDHMTAHGCLVTTVQDERGGGQHITLSCPGEWDIALLDFGKQSAGTGKSWPGR